MGETNPNQPLCVKPIETLKESGVGLQTNQPTPFENHPEVKEPEFETHPEQEENKEPEVKAFENSDCFICAHTQQYKNYCEKYKAPPSKAVKTCKGKDFQELMN